LSKRKKAAYASINSAWRASTQQEELYCGCINSQRKKILLYETFLRDKSFAISFYKERNPLYAEKSRRIGVTRRDELRVTPAFRSFVSALNGFLCSRENIVTIQEFMEV
ncbi:MAG: hypothetical protein ABJA70_12000, partial [Chryseolinea sp.]